MQPGFNGADLCFGNAGDFFEGKVFDEVQQQHGTLRQRQFIEQAHKFGLLFVADEKIVGTFDAFVGSIGNFVEQDFFAAFFPPEQEAFLVRDAKEPASKLIVLAQAADVFGSGNKSLLDEVEARLLVMDQFKNIDVKGQLVAAEERVPGRGVSFAGLLDGQLFALSHYRHFH